MTATFGGVADELLDRAAQEWRVGMRRNTVALINAILMACSQIRPNRSLSKLRQSEEEYFSGDHFY